MIVSILGCGWYGKALAKSLLAQGIQVKASTTSADKLATLQAEGIPAYHINIQPNGESIIDASFFLCDVLVIANNVKMNDETAYLSKIDATINLILQHRIQRVIFISSTSVYGDNNINVDELSPVLPETLSGKLLVKAEALLLDNPNFKTTVIRFGGLIGPGRDPGRFFAGKTDVPNGLTPINLIHLTDCVGITKHIIFSELHLPIVNAVAPHHPPKGEFYTLATKNSGLPLPGFISEKSKWKIVESLYVRQLLKYQFKVANLLTDYRL